MQYLNAIFPVTKVWMNIKEGDIHHILHIQNTSPIFNFNAVRSYYFLG